MMADDLVVYAIVAKLETLIMPDPWCTWTTDG